MENKLPFKHMKREENDREPGEGRSRVWWGVRSVWTLKTHGAGGLFAYDWTCFCVVRSEWMPVNTPRKAPFIFCLLIPKSYLWNMSTTISQDILGLSNGRFSHYLQTQPHISATTLSCNLRKRSILEKYGCSHPKSDPDYFVETKWRT